MGGKCVSLCQCFSAQKLYPHKKHAKVHDCVFFTVCFIHITIKRAKVRFFVTRFELKLNAISPPITHAFKCDIHKKNV